MKEERDKWIVLSCNESDISGQAGGFNSLKKGKIGLFGCMLLPAGIRRVTCSHILKLFFTIKRTGNLSLLMIKPHFCYGHMMPGPYLEEKFRY